MFKFFSPLEQFQIDIFYSYWTILLRYLIDSSTYYSVIGLSPYTTLGKLIFFNGLIILYLLDNEKAKFVFAIDKFSYIIDYTFLFVCNMVSDIIPTKKNAIIILFYAIFLFILISNIVGLFPIGYTITSHLIVTLYFSLGLFIGHNIVGICCHEELYFNLFLPDNIPFEIIPMLICIEFVSYFSRVLSLAIRLFANMLSGHILIKIVISFIYTAFKPENIIFIWIPACLLILVIVIEILIAFLQAYVFIILSIIYLEDTIKQH